MGESTLGQKEEPSGKAKETVLGAQFEDRESPTWEKKELLMSESKNLFFVKKKKKLIYF